jgi:polar amino acid transport system substrate-binding protein
VDFVQPYFSARVGILSPAASSAWERMRPLFNRALLAGVATLLIVLIGVGALVWQAERRSNPDQFPHAPLPGIANGMWFALVTMTTVGYGDRAPVSVAGRVVSGVWMLLAMVAASSITAGIASALTLSQIETGSLQSLDELAGRRVAVVRGTPAEKLARRRSAVRIVVDSRQAAIAAVVNGQADAMLYDLPVLDHHLRQHPELPLVAHGTPVNADDYAFAVAVDSTLRRALDRTVLELRESGAVSEIAGDWLAQPE